MKKVFLFLFVCFMINLSVCAENFPNLKYKNISIKDKISYDISTNTWSKYNGRRNTNYYIKVQGFGDFYDYVDSEQNFAFTTNCEYELIHNDALIGYSNRDMKFYEILYDKNGTGKRALTKEEVQALLPDYKVISLSDFSPKTNSLKIKKNRGALKIFLFNDTDNTFDGFVFTSGNSKFEQYDLKGFITVYKPGMIQFSRLGEQNDKNWYVLLIR